MKKLFVAAVAVLTTAVWTVNAADQAAGLSTAEKKRARMAGRIAKEGGMITAVDKGKFIRLVSTQNKVSLEEIEAVARDMERSLRTKIDVSLLPFESDILVLMEKVFAMKDTAAVIAVVDKQKGPGLLTAPECSWAVVNVDVLAMDKPTDEILKRRVRQEIWRGAVYALNGTDSQMQPCLMTKIKSLGSLDHNKMIVPSPEPIFKMLDGMSFRGVTKVHSATYRRACQEGWAPEPTNDVQRAIWDQVHATPDKPIKIKYDPKKDK